MYFRQLLILVSEEWGWFWYWNWHVNKNKYFILFFFFLFLRLDQFCKIHLLDALVNISDVSSRGSLGASGLSTSDPLSTVTQPIRIGYFVYLPLATIFFHLYNYTLRLPLAIYSPLPVHQQYALFHMCYPICLIAMAARKSRTLIAFSHSSCLFVCLFFSAGGVQHFIT